MYFTRPEKLVAVVVPLSNRRTFTAEEKISLRHLNHFLGKYDKYVLVPGSSDFNMAGFRVKPFDSQYFGSVYANNRLMLSRKFYKTFSDYKFILIYHLDSLVFSDSLAQWCEKNYDCISPPWIPYEGAPYSGMSFEGKVGNGGFSLRKVSSFLEVLKSKRKSKAPSIFWNDHLKYKTNTRNMLFFYIRMTFKYFFRNNINSDIADFRFNEDLFWAEKSKHYYKEFKFPPLDVAVSFGFETNPRLFFKKNNHRLPFGCHGWSKYDRSFWESYLLK